MSRKLLVLSTATLMLSIVNLLPNTVAYAQNWGQPGVNPDETPGGSQDGEPGASAGGVPGVSSPGSAGMPDDPAIFERDVRKAAKKGKRSLEYIGSLLALGMHYNRSQRYAKASATLNQALAIIDAGALKPTPLKDRTPDKIIEHHGEGTVSAEVIHKPLPYEETLQELLPQLATAEIGANQLAAAEIHIKRQIKLTTSNPVADKVSLMSAYSQYAELMRKLHRNKEAAEYQRKADKINSSFIPM